MLAGTLEINLLTRPFLWQMVRILVFGWYRIGQVNPDRQAGSKNGQQAKGRKSMIRRRLLIGTASVLAMAAGASPAFAQDQAASSTAASSDEETIVVTGIRGSVIASIEDKRESDVIADFLTAEDIGQFPDRNVAEALQRVPGIVINREFGEGERVSLRGTAPNLTRTLVNGHAIATADWFVLEQLAATRSFNYLTLPSEIVGQLDVYKTPSADVEEGGIGGLINVHTRDPLDLDPLPSRARSRWSIPSCAIRSTRRLRA
jgi:iron complex outermembrane receptor protein